MNGFGESINNLIANAEKNAKVNDGDYMKDGLLHCGVCNQPKQTLFVVKSLGINRIVPCLCECGVAEREREKEAIKAHERMLRIQRQRQAAFPSADFEQCTFANDDGVEPKLMDIMKSYANQFDDMAKRGKGLLLYGETSMGKSYASYCIANELIDRGYSVVCTNFIRIANTLMDLRGDKQKYLDDLNQNDLLILDDLRAERKTEFMQETVYNIIDARYRSNKPLIVTTNLTIEELKRPADIQDKRIFERVLEMCHPIEFKGANRRHLKIQKEYHEMNKLLGIE